MTQEIEILRFLHYNPEASRAEISLALTNAPSPATLKRLIADSVFKGHIEVIGRGPATRYKLTLYPELALLRRFELRSTSVYDLAHLPIGEHNHSVVVVNPARAFP